MAERSSFSTDAGILLKAALALALILAAITAGVRFLGPEQIGQQPEAQVQPTLPVYEPPTDAEGAEPSTSSESDTAGEVADAQPDSQTDSGQTGSSQPAVEDTPASSTVDAEQPDSGQPDSGQRSPGARLTAIAQGTPVPVGRLPGVSDVGMGPDARLTAIAQGTMLPGGSDSGGRTPGTGEGSFIPGARLTAIAQGTFTAGEQPSRDVGAVTTPDTDIEPDIEVAPDATATPAATAIVPAAPTSSGRGGVINAETDVEPLPPGRTLFAVARGTGAKLYDRPDGDIFNDLAPGSAVSALARSDDGLWTLVQSDDSAGWIPLEQLVLFDADSLPVFSEIEVSAGQPGTGQSAVQPTARPAEPALSQPTATSTSNSVPPGTGGYIEPVRARVASEDARLNVRAGPGTDYDVLEKISPGDEYFVLARNAASDWIQLALPESEEGTGWVATEFVDLSDTVEALPVSDLIESSEPPVLLPMPTATPTPLPALTPTAEPDVAADLTQPADVLDDVIAGEAPPLADDATPSAEPNDDRAGDVLLALRSGPGADYDVEKEIPSGLEFIELERSADGDWVRIAILEPPGGVGWIAADSPGLDAVEETEEGSDTEDSPDSDRPDTDEIDSSGSDTVGSGTIGSDAGDSETGDSDTEGAPDDPSSAIVPDVFTEAVTATVISEDTRLNVRAGPGTDFSIVEKVDPGAVLTALAQSVDGGWLQVSLADSDAETGWVASEFVELGALDESITNPDIAGSDNTDSDNAGLDNVEAPAGFPTPMPDRRSPIPTGIAPSDAAVIATVISENAFLNVRIGPGTGYDIIKKVRPDEEFVALSRTLAGDWIQIALQDFGGGAGWVATEFVELSVPVDQLEVISTEDATGSGDAGAKPDAVDSALDPDDVDALGPPQFLPAVGDDSATDAASAAADLGGTLVFEASNGGTIYAYDLDTGALWLITYGFDPAISPDGSTVAFTRDGGESGLYLVDTDGGNERLIYSGEQRLASPKWSPGGDWIVYSHGFDAYQCYPLGFGACIPVDEFGDRPAPDGIAPITWVNYHLAVVDTNGNNHHDLATLDSARAPDWNEAGIVYQSDAGLQRTADESNAFNQLIINDYLKTYFHDPDWQPGGRKIVYQGKEASHWEIFSVNPDGSGVIALTKPKTALVDVLPSNVAPVWSPDGDSIVFLSNRTDSGEAGDWRLWVMDGDGGNQRPLPIDVPITYTFGDEQVVSWGPSSSAD